MGGWVPDPRGMAQNEREVYEGIEQEIKMPLDGAGNPEAKECEVSLTAPYFTWACLLVISPFLVLRSPVRRQVLSATDSNIHWVFYGYLETYPSKPFGFSPNQVAY